MRIVFNTIKIQNFKGVRGERTIEFNPTLTQIMGANHAGKTTIVDAVQWVLFDKNSEGNTVFGIDPKNEWGEIIHHLENTVTLELTADGTSHTLMKQREETWTKPRGKEVAELTGHTNKYFIDGNKQTQKEYTQFVNDLISEDLFKVLTTPSYFPTMPADNQRKLLVKMVGDIATDEEIAGDNEDFNALLKSMAGTDLQKYREQLKYKISKLKDDIKEIPSRIEENANELETLNASKPNFELTRKRIGQIEKGIEGIDNELADLSKTVNTEFEERTMERTEINKLKMSMQAIAQTCQEKTIQEERSHKKAVADAQYVIETTERAIRNAKGSVEDAKSQLAKIEIDTKDFQRRWNELDETTFTWDENQEYCPTCKQRLPQDRIDEMRQQMEGNFNQNKSEKFDVLEQEAKRIKKRKADAEAIIATYEQKLQELEVQLKEEKAALEDKKSEKPTVYDPTMLEEYQQLQEQIKERTAALEARQQGNATESQEKQEAALRQRKAEQNKLRDELRDELNKEQRIKEKEQRIEELTEMQKTLNQQLTDLEKTDATAEQFTIAKINDLEGKVNKLFTNVQFRMFDTHITTSNIKPTCECTMHGTPYRDLSRSEKINAGIDIINAMCRFNDTYAPMFVDNAESVTDVLPTQSQQILLIVSRDKELTIIQ